MSDDIYSHWDSDWSLEKFSNMKPWDEHFRSERYFLERYFKAGMEVLDVGCGTGDLYHALKERFGSVHYTGMDISERLIDKAKEMASDATFVHGNALKLAELVQHKEFDLVTATGVFQHEPNGKELLRNMLDRTRMGGMALFDLKLFHTHETLSDINRAYGDHKPPDSRVYFIVYHLNDLLNMILDQEGVAEIECFGYYAGTHKSVHLPDSVDEPVASAHILVKRGERSEPFPVSMHLPEEFFRAFGKRKHNS